MQLTRNISIQALAALTVTATSPEPQAYLGDNMYVDVLVLPATPSTYNIVINWGNGFERSYTFTVSTPSFRFSYQYPAVGTYNVNVTVTDTVSGAIGSDMLTVQINNLLNVSFSADKTSGQVPLTVNFAGSISGGYPVYTWTLDYGDGTSPSSGTGSPVSRPHTYSVAGTFTARLTVTDSMGLSLFAETVLVPGQLVVAPDWVSIGVPFSLGLIGIYLGTTRKRRK